MQSIDPNILSLIGSGVVTVTSGILLARYSAKNNARERAEAILLGMPVGIIAEQNKRIDNLSEQLERLFEREQECQEQLRAAISNLSAAHARLTTMEAQIRTLSRRIDDRSNLC